jgi:drug/metabolite transporter (DMT)-like permease
LSRPNPTVGYVQVLAGAVLFGVNASVSKVVLTAGVEPARLTALRCTGAAAGLFLLLGLTRPGSLRITRAEVPSLIVLGLTGAALLQWFYFIAIERLPVGIALLIEFTGPLLVAAYSALVLHEAVGARLWLALGIALAGMALVAQVWTDLGLDGLGVAAACASAVCLATFYLQSKRSVAARDPLSLSAWMFAFAALFWAVAQPWWAFDPSVLTEEVSLLGTFADSTAPVWVALLWVIVLGTLVPYAFEVASLRHLPPTVTGLVAMVEPVVAGAVAWWWLDEVLTGWQVLGGFLVLVGVGLVQANPETEVEAAPAVT